MTIRKDSGVQILVADDNEAVRNALCSVLESQEGWTVCGEAADGNDAFKKAIELRPDVILVDVSMPCLNGFETAARI
ncbi:MAG TPA: response regulator transcription factor, partial [Terriglobia bacterium]|nr:response regulator transcription factor [Terriglobia bacterium]